MLELILVKSLFLLFVMRTAITTKTDVRIVGGRYAGVGEFPYQVSIRRTYNDAHICGGTIITPKHILTAAHCLFYMWGGIMPPSIIKVVAGQVELKSSPLSISRPAGRIIIHSDYDQNTMANDIAIIVLDEELPSCSDLVSAVPLNREYVTQNTSCTVSGWGVENFNSHVLSQQLLATEVFLLDPEECQRRYTIIDVTLFEGMICAMNDRKEADACQGDSGGPLVCEGHLTGIISTGKECANSQFPGVYTDVHYFLPWITEYVGLEYLSTVGERTTASAAKGTVTNSQNFTSLSDSTSFNKGKVETVKTTNGNVANGNTMTTIINIDWNKTSAHSIANVTMNFTEKGTAGSSCIITTFQKYMWFITITVFETNLRYIV